MPAEIARIVPLEELQLRARLDKTGEIIDIIDRHGHVVMFNVMYDAGGGDAGLTGMAEVLTGTGANGEQAVTSGDGGVDSASTTDDTGLADEGKSES